MSSPGRAPQLAFWLGAGLFISLMALGAVEAIRTTGRLPAVGLTYDDELERLDDEASLDAQWSMAMVLDFGRLDAAVQAAQRAARRGDTEAERAALAQWVRLAPDDPASHKAMGVRLLGMQLDQGKQTGQMDAEEVSLARDHLAVAARLDPADPDIQHHLGAASRMLGDEQAAARHAANAERLRQEATP